MTLTGPPFIIAAAFLWGLSGGLQGLLIEHGWAPLFVSFARGAIGWIGLLAWWLASRDERLSLNWRLIGGATLAGVGVAGNLAFYCVSIAHTNVAVAATLLYTAPLDVFVVSYLLGIERLTVVRCVSLALIFVGVVLLTDVWHSGVAALSWIGIGAGLASGASYAAFIFGFRYANRVARPQTTLVLAFAVFCIVLAPWVDFAGGLAITDSADGYGLIALGVFGAGLSFPLYIVGLRASAPVLASIVAMIEPVTAALFGVFILGDSLAPIQILGGVLIIATVTYMSLQSTH